MSLLNELSLFAKNYSILVVEDDKDLNNELVEITKLFFKKVDMAYDGEEALEKYKSNFYDLVLTDITMPKMNGVSLSREIKILNSQQQVIVLSAHQEINYLIELIDIGINQFVTKPFEQSELLYRLLKVCENIFYKEEYVKLLKNDLDNKSKNNTLKTIEKNQENKTTEIKSNNITSNNNINHKRVDAKEFISQMKKDNLAWNSMEGQLEELFQLNEEFNEEIEKIYLNDISSSTIMAIANILKKIHDIFSYTEELFNLAKVLLSLSTFLHDLDLDSLSEDKKNKLKILEFIYDDISRFIETVFVYEDTLDVYYLEDSLKSSIEQLKMNLLNEKIEEEDFEFFL